MPQVSVIIPSYNRARYVTKAIDSVLAQTYRDYEIIVVDSSTDNTQEVLRAYSNKTRYFYQERAGVSAARNLGIQQATGEWIALLDSDDEWLPERLAVQMEEIAREPRLVAHFTNLAFIMPDGREVRLFELRGNLREGKDSWTIERPLIEQLKYQFCFSSNYLGRRKALFDVGLFDERLTIHEDLDLFFRLALAGPWGVNSKVLVQMFRRDEPANINLSRQHKDRPIYSYECLVHIYNKLRSNENLQPHERRLVNEHLSGARFNLGTTQLNAGDKRAGFSNIRQSFQDNPSLRSLAKYLLVRSLGGAGVRLIEARRALLTKGFWRPDSYEDKG